METGNIIDRLDRIEKALKFIQENMISQDSIMTDDEEKRYKKAMRELKEGKTMSLERLEKELGM